jgi:hypothetical protein
MVQIRAILDHHGSAIPRDGCTKLKLLGRGGRAEPEYRRPHQSMHDQILLEDRGCNAAESAAQRYYVEFDEAD